MDKSRDIWVVTEMCAQYLESAVDAIIVVRSKIILLGRLVDVRYYLI